MKGNIFYFSGTGNTKYIAEIFYKELRKNEVNVSIHSVEYERCVDISGLDFIILGFPIYADNAPMYFIDWMEKNIPDADKEIKAIIFSTRASSGSGVELVGRKMIKKGYKVVIKKGFNMPNNYYFHKGFKSTPAEKREYLLKESKKQAEETMKLFLEDKSFSDKHGILRITMADVVSRVAAKFLRGEDKKFSVSDSCIRCGICVNSCPSGNISLKDKIEFNHNCYFCTRCIHVCPVNAIKFNGKTYEQYNMLLGTFKK